MDNTVTPEMRQFLEVCLRFCHKFLGSPGNVDALQRSCLFMIEWMSFCAREESKTHLGGFEGS